VFKSTAGLPFSQRAAIWTLKLEEATLPTICSLALIHSASLLGKGLKSLGRLLRSSSGGSRELPVALNIGRPDNFPGFVGPNDKPESPSQCAEVLN